MNECVRMSVHISVFSQLSDRIETCGLILLNEIMLVPQKFSNLDEKFRWSDKSTNVNHISPLSLMESNRYFDFMIVLNHTNSLSETDLSIFGQIRGQTQMRII